MAKPTDDKPSAIRAQLEDGRGAKEEGEANVFDKPDGQRSSLLEYAAMARTDDKPSAMRAQLEDGRGAKEKVRGQVPDSSPHSSLLMTFASTPRGTHG